MNQHPTQLPAQELAAGSIRRGRITLAFGVIVFLADVFSKEAITTQFQLHEFIAQTTFLNIGHWLNPGAAFSFLSDAGGWQRYFFSAVALLAVVWFAFSLFFNEMLDFPTQVAFSLIVGGAAGNLYDRITRGAVVDWIDFYWGSWHWPAFNLADCAIVGGALLVILSTLRSPKRLKQH